MMTPTVEWILAAAGVVTALGALIYPARVGGRLLKTADNFFEDWNGAPARPGVPARLPFPERMTTLETSVGGLRTEVTVLQGDVSGLRSEVGELRDEVGELRDEVSTVRHEVMPNGGDSMRDAVDRIERGGGRH